MCRHNQLIGFALMSFGLGVLVGTLLTSGLVCCLVGLGALIFGFFLVQKK